MRRLISRSFLVPSMCLLLATACSGSDPADAAGSAGSNAAASGGNSNDSAGASGSNAGGNAGNSGTAQDPTLNAGEYSVAAFAYQDNKATGFNPLGRDRFNLLRLEETAIIATQPGDAGWYADDAQHELTQSPLLAALVPAGATPVWTASGNLDADGNAELVVISRDAKNLLVAIGDNDGNKPLANVRSFSVAHAGATAGAIKAALGDFDGDGRDEISVAVTTSANAGWVRVYDDAVSNFALVKDVVVIASGQADVDLAAGNFDADPALELAVLRIGTARDNLDVKLFDDAAHAFAELKVWRAENLLPGPGMGDKDTRWMSGGFLRAGNVDADAQDELYVLLSHLDAGSGSGGTRIMGHLIDDVSNTAKEIATPAVGAREVPRGELARPYDAVFADLDGDALDELYFLHLESDDPTFAWKLTQWNPSNGEYAWSKKANYSPLDSGYNAVSYGRLAVIDGDGLIGESLVAVLKNSGMESPIKTLRIGAQATVQPDDLKQSFAINIPKPEVTQKLYPSSLAPLVTGGDFDNDSLQVRYTGDHWQTLSQPRPIVVMAAPPVRDGITQNYNSTETAFGQEVVRGSATTHELGANYSTTLSFETSTLTSLLGDLGGLFGASVSKTMERAFSSSETTRTLQSYGTSYSGAYPDDCIVFQGVLYTSYAYEVVSASDPSVIGQRMTIDVPAAIKTYKWTLDFYNEKLGPQGIRISAETLKHQTGNPASYLTPLERDAILSKAPGFQSKQVAVGQGNGANTVSINLEQEKTTASTNTITNEDSWGVSIAGAGYTDSRSVTETGIYEVTVGSATNYQGSVGDILDHDHYLNYAYDFGMLVYTFEHPQGPRFQVINYWTSNLGPGFN